MKKQLSSRKKNRTAWIILTLAAIIIILIVALTVHSKKDSASATPQAEMLNIPFAKQGTLAFTGKEGNDTLAVIDIEVADNDQRRARGLMYRSSIPENAGMLFIHDVEDVQSFWMKNTYISLDMIFVNAQKEIVTIHAATAPLKEWNYTSTAPALYVVEVNAGFCARNNIKVGDRVGFEF